MISKPLIFLTIQYTCPPVTKSDQLGLLLSSNVLLDYSIH